MTAEDKQHDKDVFVEGDRIPYRSTMATVVRREVVEEIPDDYPDHGHPSEYSDVVRNDDINYVLLTIDPDPDELTKYHTMATTLADNLSHNFNEHGLPTVRSEMRSGMGTTGKTRVQTPATGNNHLDRHDVRSLASFIRANKGFTPLYALLGGVDSPTDMEDLAEALDRAALVRDYSAKVSGE